MPPTDNAIVRHDPIITRSVSPKAVMPPQSKDGVPCGCTSVRVVLALLMTVMFVLLNLVGTYFVSYRGASVAHYFRHGWPLVFMHREAVDGATAQVALTIHASRFTGTDIYQEEGNVHLRFSESVFPFDSKTIIAFHLGRFAIDAIVSVALIIGAFKWLSHWLPPSIVRFSLRGLMIFVGLVAVSIVSFTEGTIDWRMALNGCLLVVVAAAAAAAVIDMAALCVQRPMG